MSDSHRRRSRSPDDRERRHHSSKRSRRSPSRSDDGRGGPPAGVEEIGKDDFFLKANELKLWLSEEKSKRFDQLSGEDARRQFKKFCKRWNNGDLPAKYYNGISAASLPSSISSSHKWSFAKATQRELDDAAFIRKQVDGGGRDGGPLVASSSSARVGPARPPGFGPVPPSALEQLQLERDAAASLLDQEKHARKGEWRKETREARQEEKSNAATGRDRLLEQRAQANASNKAFAAQKEGGMQEFGEDFLLGGQGGSYAEALAARERAKQRGGSKRQEREQEKQAVYSDKAREFRAKEDATMDMFKKLAAERFGGGV